jgi:hypothetical protein
MKTEEKPKTCANPLCGKPLTNDKPNKKYCCRKCQYTHNNALTKQRYEENFKDGEAQKRHNVKVLKKLLLHPKYQNSRIERHYLNYEGFHTEACTLPTAEQQAQFPERDIAWSHNYGIEVIGVEKQGDSLVEWITIHHNPKIQ